MAKKKRRRSKTRSALSLPTAIKRWWRGLLIVGLFLGGLIVIGLVIIWGWGERVFPVNYSKNILLVSSNINDEKGKVYLVSLQPAQQKIKLIALDEYQQLNVAGGYGQYQLRAVYPLLKLEKKNDQFQQAALSWSLGTIVDKVVVLPVVPVIDSRSTLKLVFYRRLLTNWYRLKSRASDVANFLFINQVADEKVVFEKVSDVADLPRLTTVTANTTGCEIAVINTTQVSGLASRFAAIAEKNGLMVVRVVDQPQTYETTSFVYDPETEACEAAVERLSHLIPSRGEEFDNQELRHQHRAELVIMLGQDLVELF